MDLKRAAVKLQIKWLEANSFPVPETEAFVNCMVHVRTALPSEVSAEFTEILQLVLNRMKFSSHNRPNVELLYAVCEPICKQLRDEKLFWTLFQGIRENFSADELAGNAMLMRYILSAGRLAGQQKERNAAFQLVAPLVVKMEGKEIRSVIRALTSGAPDKLRPFMIEWVKKFEHLKPAEAAVLARDFVQDVTPHVIA